MNTIIYVLTHKEFEIPHDDLFVPLLNGSSSHEDDFGYQRDDTGDNISDLNEYYAELTGEYWTWKNSNVDIIGFCHYRRYFAKNISLKLLEKSEIEEILTQYDIIMPDKIHMGMSNIEEIKESKKNIDYGPNIEEYYKLREVISKNYPDYLQYYDEMLNEKECYWFNMFICKKEVADEYFEWLFGILKIMENEIDFSNYGDGQKRILGFLSERLINVFIKKNNLRVKEKPLYLPDRRFPVLYVIGYRFSIIIVLFKLLRKVKLVLSRN